MLMDSCTSHTVAKTPLAEGEAPGVRADFLFDTFVRPVSFGHAQQVPFHGTAPLSVFSLKVA